VSRTSISHPLCIAELPIGSRGGAVGVTFAPGKRQLIALTGAWERDLDLDLAAIRAWGATRLITLLEPWELEELAITALPTRAAAHELEWQALPITDGAAPDARLLEFWSTLAPQLVQELEQGARVVVHCKGGLGRAGTVACLLLLEASAVEDVPAAIALVRQVRPGAIETAAQEAFLHEWAELRRPRAGVSDPAGGDA
jgi:ADP-ribosyl-[dinitrogen reductase] hydrolase